MTHTPIDDIPEVLWSSLARGADDPSHPMHLLTLATVTVDRRPSARLMVNRGADRATGRLWFHTDVSSPKVADLRAGPWANVVAWDPRLVAQVRLSGPTVLHEADAVAEAHWAQWSRQAMWVYEHVDQAPATPTPDLRLPADQEQLAHRMTKKSRAQFVVIELQVETADWLQVVGPRQYRAVLHRADHWHARWV